MSKNVVIVESPAKSKTIKKYLGKDFEVLASYGHVRDLVSKNGSVDPDNDFAMKYQNIERNKKHIDAIKAAVKKADTIYLAADPDREGEAIAWNVIEILKKSRILKDKVIKRVAFNEITKTAVTDAIKNPRDVSMDLVNAQQARLALDYLVGFTLSPVLWKKIRYGLSAGRVQSPALGLIVERELEIEAFDVKEYWSIRADLNEQKKSFSAKLHTYAGKKLEQFDLTNEMDATAAVDVIAKDANGELIVSKIAKKQKKRNPAAPFITSTIQQEAAKKYGFTAKKTMMVAQQLYEGINIGDETVGLITYMRTDSINLSKDAVTELRDFISSEYGASNLPDSSPVYKTKSKNAQEAHEAIRPSSALRRPIDIKDHLNADQLKLYSLVWKRTVASQMIHATMNTVSIDLVTENEKHLFKASGSVVAIPGFLSVYQETVDEDEKQDPNAEMQLPALKEKQKVKIEDIIPKQHFTEPPPRYSEASLVKALEEFGIGRPSTYASIISTLQARDYVTMVTKRFHPTDVGRVVNKFLTQYFAKYVEYGYTSKLEDELDAVANGKKEWLTVMEKFWKPFNSQVEKVEGSVKKSDVTSEKIDEKCPECEHDLNIKLGRRGKFIACTNYPECKFTRAIKSDGQPAEPEEPEVLDGRKCELCESDLHIKEGRYGKFIGCSSYPDCKHMEPLVKPKDTGVTCPQCNDKHIMEKISRKGKTFFACSGFPKCKYALWYLPLAEECPKCKWPILMHKVTKKFGEQKACPGEGCDYTLDLESTEE